MSNGTRLVVSHACTRGCRRPSLAFFSVLPQQLQQQQQITNNRRLLASCVIHHHHHHHNNNNNNNNTNSHNNNTNRPKRINVVPAGTTAITSSSSSSSITTTSLSSSCLSKRLLSVVADSTPSADDAEDAATRTETASTTTTTKTTTKTTTRLTVKATLAPAPQSSSDNGHGGSTQPQSFWTTNPTTQQKERVQVSVEDVEKEETTRKGLNEVLISEVLKAKHSYRWVDPVVLRSATVRETIVTAIEGGLSGMMVVEASTKHVVGLLTSRDLLRIMAAGIREGESSQDIMDRCVGDYMTPISQVIYARPDETVGICRTLMARLGIKCLPVLSRQGFVEGILTARDMSDFGLSAKEKGGKRSYLEDVSARVGLSSTTSMAEPPSYLKSHLALEQKPLFVNVGTAALPHPFKTPHGSGRNQRDTRQTELTMDSDLSEDSHFVTSVYLPDHGQESGVVKKFTYLGVADGVGSWREYGVDPREFSRRFTEECINVLHEAASHVPANTTTGNETNNNSINKDNNSRDNNKETRPPRRVPHVLTPSEVMAKAYDRVKAQNVIGSTTACIALFDGTRHQLHFSNLGDSGIIVLRHIDSDVAGSLKRDRHTPRVQRESDLRLAFVSQQQLRSFNHPFQLGWTGEDVAVDENTSFKTADQSCSSSIHVRRGDIIIMATDGLFDNVDVDDICSMALEWEQRHGFIRGGDVVARERRWAMGNSLTNVSAEFVPALAQLLCEKARENSMDPALDSPFAILAKENDIMWSGGMPDDCTVIVIHVVGTEGTDLMSNTNK